jgi:EmrB/QacA subfamily drug resistance transporter
VIAIDIEIVLSRMTIMPSLSIAARSTSDTRRWIALVVVLLGQMMIVLDASIVNVALPAIQRDLRFSQANLTWVVNAYMITFGSFLLMAGRLGDLVGRKRVFLAGLVLFTGASVACGLAQDQAVLVSARFLQGLGGALASAVILAIIVTEFPEPLERAKAMSLYMFVAVSGGSLGLLAGGAITQSIDWHWIFFINVPIGALALALGLGLIADHQGIGLGEGIDVLGSVLVTLALMLGIYAIVTSTEHGWGSLHTIGFGAGALALLAAFAALEARLANPILPLRIFRLRTLIGSSAVRSLVTCGMFTVFFLGALYFEHVRGYSALNTGLAFLPMTLTVATLSLGITARLVTRFGPMRVLFPGLAATVASLLLLSQAGEHTAYFPTVFVAFVLMGLGAGGSFMPLLTIAMSDVPRADAGLASGIVNVSMWVAAAIGLAALGTAATDHTRTLTEQGHPLANALTGGYHLAFTIGAVVVAAGVLVALVALPRAGGGAQEEVDRRVPAEAEPEAQAA